jgi:hypothetical protein
MMTLDDAQIVMALMSDSSMLISRCSFCAHSLLIVDRQPGLLLPSTRLVCGLCGIETQWHSCFYNEEARAYIQREATRLGKEELRNVAMDTGLIRHMFRTAEEKGWLRQKT